MLLRHASYRLVFAASAALLFVNLPARSEEPPPAATPGVGVLARGPIHEAFAQPADGQPQLGPLVPKEPPAPLNELPPDVRPEGDNVQWVPGYWQWDDERADFIWVSGFWRSPPPGRKWVPGYYTPVQGGYQWVEGFWAPADQNDLSYQPPPPESVENGPSMPAPSDDAIYDPGTWVYQDSRYAWRPGSYIGFRPGWVWVPAHYVWTPAGYLFVAGYWDYALADRGLLTAPVYCDPAVCFRPGFVYRPSCVFPSDVLTGALFVRPGWRHYYVGDYFDAGYRRAGFTAFVDFRFGRGAGYDPLYAYYRAAHRGDTWERDLRAQYAGRFDGTLARPPRTLVQQNTFIRNTVNVTNVKNVTLLAPLSRNADVGVRLATVAPQQLTATRQTVSQVRDVTRQRRDLETRLVQGHGPLRANDPPRTATLNAPKAAFVTEHKPVTAPPRPIPVTTSGPGEQAPRVIRHDPPPKFETKPIQVETRPPVRTETPPPVIKHDTPPAVIHHAAPPAVRHDAPPPVMHHDAPAVIHHDTPPARSAPPARTTPAPKAAQHAAAPARTPAAPRAVQHVAAKPAPTRPPVQHVAVKSAPAKVAAPRPVQRAAPKAAGPQPKRR
jgi:hypothetical protein